jgi:deoxyribodipyrimidine photolyase-related protein
LSAQEPNADIRHLAAHLASEGILGVHICECSDDWLHSRINKACKQNGLHLTIHATPLFLNTKEQLAAYVKEHNRFFQTDFYISQRKQRNILLQNGKPLGGKWSYDADNRARYPKDQSPPQIKFAPHNSFLKEAIAYVQQHYSHNPGEIPEQFYPFDYATAASFLKAFLAQRLEHFGVYEDAIVAHAAFLHHSVLSPLINNGLLTPQQVLDSVLQYYTLHEQLPLNSIEGFIRQLIGWREFMRMVYVFKGRQQRTTNFWGFTRKIPATFWTVNTGILPVDQVIGKVLKHAYCHHIERLMVLGNFMLLCEFDPDDVYHWFSCLFIDAYDWVMVPNIYGMSQFADGGILATKPYISGSNYLMKMSDYPKGDWQQVWDGLFWRFIHKHRDFFSKNPRLNMMVRTFDKMKPEQQQLHLQHAATFLQKL